MAKLELFFLYSVLFFVDSVSVLRAQRESIFRCLFTPIVAVQFRFNATGFSAGAFCSGDDYYSTSNEI